MQPELQQLLATAEEAEAVRTSVDAKDSLVAVANLSASDSAKSQSMVASLIDGLRFGPKV